MCSYLHLNNYIPLASIANCIIELKGLLLTMRSVKQFSWLSQGIKTISYKQTLQKLMFVT